jgi:hypothetical protein
LPFLNSICFTCIKFLSPTKTCIPTATPKIEKLRKWYRAERARSVSHDLVVLGMSDPSPNALRTRSATMMSEKSINEDRSLRRCSRKSQNVQREDGVLVGCDGHGTTSMGCGIKAKINACRGVVGVGDGDDEMSLEERGNAVLPLLSPIRQTSSHVCLTCWSATRPCTVLMRRQFCFCLSTVEVSLTSDIPRLGVDSTIERSGFQALLPR